MNVRLFTTAFFALTFAMSIASADDTYFDEIFDKNGEVYPHYREAYEAWSDMSKTAKVLFLTSSRKAFQGDNALDPMLRVIPAQEYDQVLKAGVQQRALAIRSFLEDHYSGKKHTPETRSFLKMWSIAC